MKVAVKPYLGVVVQRNFIFCSYWQKIEVVAEPCLVVVVQRNPGAAFIKLRRGKQEAAGLVRNATEFCLWFLLAEDGVATEPCLFVVVQRNFISCSYWQKVEVAIEPCLVVVVQRMENSVSLLGKNSLRVKTLFSRRATKSRYCS